MSHLGAPLAFPLGGDAEEEGAGASAVERVRDIYVDELTRRWVLTSRGDLRFTGHDLAGVAQACRQALRLNFKEWYLDESAGLPWLPDPDDGTMGLLDKDPDLGLVKEFVRSALVGVAGIREVLRLEVTVDGPTRAMTVSFTCDTDLGELTAAEVV